MNNGFTTSDAVGFGGVAILLAAYLLNLAGKLDREGSWYIGLNVLGAGMSCLASVLIHYVPFIILEAAWMAVSLFALVSKFMRRKALR